MGDVQPSANENYILEAISLAKKYKGKTFPNPPVGAVVVDEQGVVIGRGYHPQAGLPHAEVYAINEALNKKTDLSDCTLFITLEPCGHFGKTPPCVNIILEKGIKKIVVGTLDPHPLMQGKSVEKLQKSGVEVVVGVCEEECRKLIRGFTSSIKNKRPFITLKCAISLDGKLSTSTGESKWITGFEARQYGHTIRADHDAILVGVGTILADNPSLDVRLNSETRGLTKVILDSRLQTPSDSKIFSTQGHVIIYCDQNFSQTRKNELEKSGASIVPSVLKNNQIDLDFVIHDLSQKGVQELLVEGGAKTLQSFLSKEIFDEIKYFVAPKIISDRTHLSESLSLNELNIKKVGSDFVFEGRR